MKLILFKVLSDFRNLRGVELRFSDNVSTYVLIGNNGAGKSSLLEALSSVFHALFMEGPPSFEFAFVLVFENEGKKILIENTPDGRAVFKIDGDDSGLKSIAPFLPQRVICNYSGEETRINRNYYLPVWDQYERRLKATSGGGPLRMFFVDKDLWKIILFVIVSNREAFPSFKEFLKDVLQVEGEPHISIDIDKKALESWSDNPASYYMRRLAERIQPDGTIPIADVNPDNVDAFPMFSHLSSARSLIKDMKIVFEKGIDADFFSEGEKKWMVVLFVLEVISNERSLVLLDEPDSHIHVARKPQLAQLFKQFVNRDNIITSHSPTLTAAFDQNEIIMLDHGQDGCALVVDNDKQMVVSKLTDGLWTLQKQNIFLASRKDILLVEGKTDETFLSKALEIFHADGRFQDQTYEFLPCGGADGVVSIMEHFPPKPQQRIFCLLDNDGSGWKGINSIFQSREENQFNSRNFGRARKIGNIWVVPYPCSHQRANNFNVEDYFPRRLFLHHVLSFRTLNDVISKKRLKDAFEEDCNTGRLKPSDFKKFSTVFLLLETVKKADSAGKDHI